MSSMKLLFATLLAAAITAVTILGGCTKQPAAPPPGFVLTTDTRQLMNWLLDPAADVIWASAGTIITVEGEQDLSPTTDEGWADVRNSAALLAEAGNLLLLSGRSRGTDWDEYSLGMIDAAQRTIAAAQAQDTAAIFDLGGELYRICVACHQHHAITPAAATNIIANTTTDNRTAPADESAIPTR